MKQSVVRAEVTKNRDESFPPSKPSVPGPTESARTLIKAKAPLMIPKPNPETGVKKRSGHN